MAYDAPLRRVLQIIGGPAKLGRLLGINASAVTQWRRVPATRLPQVIELSGLSGQVLRPDLYKGRASTHGQLRSRSRTDAAS